MRTPIWVVAALALAACGKQQDKPGAGSATGSAASASAVPAEPAPPRPKIDGPAVAPAITRSIAFVVPKDTSFWGELNFACYRAVMSLTGTRTAGEAFENLSPTVPAAMRAGGIDLGRDLAAIGGFDCGGSPCFYVAASLQQPEKMGEVLKTLLPGTPPQDHGKGHYSIDTQGTRGTRTIHVRVVPIRWPATLPSDPWSKQAAAATHVVFIGGVDGKNVDLDPLTALADPATALAHVKEAEAVLPDANGRCLLGLVGPRDFQPGYKLDRARFALAAPSGKGDPLMSMLGSQRTLDLEVELALTPAPRPADAARWIAAGRQWMSGIAAPMRAQFAGNPMLDVYFDMISLLGERGFRHDIAAQALRFSWRTDRVPGKDLAALEARFEAVMGTGAPE